MGYNYGQTCSPSYDNMKSEVLSTRDEQYSAQFQAFLSQNSTPVTQYSIISASIDLII